MNYRIKRSNRRSIALELTPEGLLVRAPHRATEAEIEQVITKHRRWIDTHMQRLARQREQAQQDGPLSDEDIRALTDQARDYIPRRVAHYAPLIGIDPSKIGRVTIRSQKTRWGSCSAKGNLNFNCLLVLLSDDVIDSVVVHELCHRKQMNHSAAFYKEVERVFPEYKKCDKWLKKNGSVYLGRLP